MNQQSLPPRSRRPLPRCLHARGQGSHRDRKRWGGLSVREYGTYRADHTVVLLHGLCLSKAFWDLQIAELIRQWGDNLRIIAYRSLLLSGALRSLVNTLN
jgi:hypothetical protein